ncbi:BglG family transcription antiterminator [Anaerosporobacter sp.]
MITYGLSERCKKVMNILLHSSEYIPLQMIAEQTEVSKRSVYYDICSINEWLDSKGIAELEMERGKGILIPYEDKQKIEELLEDKQEEEYYVFSPSERVKIIICYLIHSKKAVYVDQIMEVCQVSRNTVFGDMRIVVNQLNEYGLEVKYESKKGYRIVGDIIRMRALFFLYFNSLTYLFNSGILKFLKRDEIHGYLNNLYALKEELRVEYVDGSLLALAALLPIMFHNKEKILFPGLKKEEIIRSREYQLILKYFSELEEDEKIYLCLHLLGSRVSAATDEIFESRSNQSVYGIVKALVTEFEKTACVIFEDREELERSLFMHINTSMYRYQYGIQIGNPLSEDIVREYPDLFEITKNVSGYLEHMIGVPIPDGEVAYLALHFGASLKVSKQRGNKLRILIVCVNGISTGNMIKREIKKLLPEAEIVDVVAVMDVINVQNVCDLVISTVKIKSVVPVIVVSPILSDEDRKRVLNHQIVYYSQKKEVTDTLYNTVKKYVPKELHDSLRKDIVRCIHGERECLDVAVLDKEAGILEYLNPSKMVLSDELITWQDSILLAGQSLIENGSIERGYLDTIISQTLYYGPYMFITDDIMLAHAKPEDGVKRLDVAMAIFQNPIFFAKDKKAKIIFVLAAEDQEKHLKILNDILRVAESEEYQEVLCKIDTCEEIFLKLNQILSE